jgi:uncharacterized protein (DUF302 family)
MLVIVFLTAGLVVIAMAAAALMRIAGPRSRDERPAPRSRPSSGASTGAGCPRAARAARASLTEATVKLDGVVTKRSASGYSKTVARVIGAIERRGLTLFAQIDHAAAAREAGLELLDEQVVLFGNPRAGTPLMRGDPRIGVELPLRILIWADASGVLIGYLDPRELGARYDLAAEQAPILERMASLLAELADEAAGSPR